MNQIKENSKGTMKIQELKKELSFLDKKLIKTEEEVDKEERKHLSLKEIFYDMIEDRNTLLIGLSSLDKKLIKTGDGVDEEEKKLLSLKEIFFNMIEDRNTLLIGLQIEEDKELANKIQKQEYGNNFFQPLNLLDVYEEKKEFEVSPVHRLLISRTRHNRTEENLDTTDSASTVRKVQKVLNIITCHNFQSQFENFWNIIKNSNFNENDIIVEMIFLQMFSSLQNQNLINIIVNIYFKMKKINETEDFQSITLFCKTFNERITNYLNLFHSLKKEEYMMITNLLESIILKEKKINRHIGKIMNIISQCDEKNCEICSEISYKLIPSMISISSEKTRDFLQKLLNSKKPKNDTMSKEVAMYLNCKDELLKIKEEENFISEKIKNINISSDNNGFPDEDFLLGHGMDTEQNNIDVISNTQNRNKK